MSALCFVVALTSALVPPTEPSAAAPRLALARARWKEACEVMHVPGMAVVGVAGGKVAFTECLGVRRAGAAAPVDENTRFYIASVTKTFIAAAAKVLEEDGTLALTDPVQKFLPQFTLADAKTAEALTIEDLLCHRPGLSCEPVVFRDAYTGQIDDATYFALLADARPAGHVEYTNIHFTIAGRVVAAAAHDTWQAVLEKRVFAPLKLTRTTARASVLWGDANSCETHVGVKDGAAIVPHKSDRTMHAAGGLGTTAHDAARWLLFQLGDGTLDGTRVMSKDGLADMHRTHSSLERPDEMRPDTRFDGFGLAWQLGVCRGETACVHGGGYTGATCIFAFLPGKNVGAAVLLNRDSGAAMELALCDALDVLLGRDLDPSIPDGVRKSAARVDWPQVSSPAVNPALEPGALSLPVDRYVGRYVSEPWGEIEVRLDHGALRFALGDWDCELHSTGEDAFDARQSIVNVIPGKFESDADTGTVDGVELRFDRQRRFFERVGG